MKAFPIILLALSLLLPLGAAADHCGEQKQCGSEENHYCTDNDKVCLNLQYPSFGGINLRTDQALNTFVGWLYYFIVGISGFAAFVMIVWAGIQWMTSAGNPGTMADARDKMQKALLGLLLVLVSFLILQAINPELTVLESLSP